MFRRKFIDRLRNKYNQGNLKEPNLSIGGRSINTDNGTRYGAGAKLSAPFLESIRHGSDASGLRFETDFVGTNSGPVSISNDEGGKAYNASLGLRGYHNRYINRNNTLSLNSNIGAGIGTGDENGDGEMNPFVDANLSLLKSGRTRKGTSISGGPTLSYGTEGSPNQGLQLGLKGNYGALSGNVGYDITNKSPKIGASLNFQEGGMYNQMQQYKMGGQQLPGGEMEPIPGSDAVEFNGQSHDEGGIMVDNQTEVEDGETMDQVTMAKHGGKRKDYFFSSYLKEGGVSYADMHKEILAEGGDQSKIDWLAQMQEKAAGRPADKIQTAEHGGVKKYQTGDFHINPDGSFNDEDDIDQNNIYDPTQSLIPYHNKKSDAIRTRGSESDRMIKAGFVWNGTAWMRPEKEKKVEKKVVISKKNNKNVDNSDTRVPTPEENITPIPMIKPWEVNKSPIEPFVPSPVSLEKQEDIINKEGSEESRTLLDRLKEKARRGDIPPEAYIAGVAQLLPAAYSYFHKQPDAEQADYTPGFTSPIISERGKGAKLDRVNYNVERATNASDMRGINKFIETSGGGPANIINKMMSYSKKQQGDAKINAAETRANTQIANQEAQLQQQMDVNNMSRAQQASTTNAQMIRAEAARMDQIGANNAAARQKIKDDEEFQKYAGIGATASGIAGLAGDALSYKASERMARAIGSEGIYDRDKLRDVVTRYAAKSGIPDGKGGWICTAGNCTETDINTYITSENKTKKETKDEE
jgi:hypothetical protein